MRAALVTWTIVVAMVIGMVVTWPSSAVTTFPTEHIAKVRAFRVMLEITEHKPDVIDTTQATIAIGQCRRVPGAWRCRTGLSPVAMSGIPGLTCTYVVRVYRHSTRVSERAC